MTKHGTKIDDGLLPRRPFWPRMYSALCYHIMMALPIRICGVYWLIDTAIGGHVLNQAGCHAYVDTDPKVTRL